MEVDVDFTDNGVAYDKTSSAILCLFSMWTNFVYIIFS